MASIDLILAVACRCRPIRSSDRRFWIEDDAAARSTRISFQWIDRPAPALGIAGYPVRERLQLAALRLSRRSSHLWHAGAADDGRPDGFAGCRAPAFRLRSSRDRQSAISRGNGLAGERRAHRAIDPHAAGRCDGRVSVRQRRSGCRRDVANAHGRRGAQGGRGQSGRTVPFELDRIRQRCASSIPIERYYETLRALGLEYGPSFRAIEMLQRGNGEVLTRVRLPPHLSADGHPGCTRRCSMPACISIRR